MIIPFFFGTKLDNKSSSLQVCKKESISLQVQMKFKSKHDLLFTKPGT
jgi:hypothetical protein